jgi:hypothetical protein
VLRLFGALFLILIGAAIGAQMCSGPSNPPPPSGAHVRDLPPAIAVATPAGAPAAIAQPPTHEEKLAATNLQDQQNRTYSWDGGWLRLETIEFSKQATRAGITLFVAHGDLFYVDLAGTSLVAGPMNAPAVNANFPQLRSEKPWQTVYSEQLESRPGSRVPEATATTYSVDFQPMNPATVLDRVFVKLRFWEPSKKEPSNTVVLTTGGALSLQRGEVASLLWDTALKREISH